MRKPLRKIAVAGVAAFAATALAGGPAMADPSTSWAISPTGSFGGTSSMVNLSVNGIDMVCTTAVADGTTVSSPATGNPAKLADITNADFGTIDEPCTSFLGPVTTVSNTPWTLMATDYNAATGETTGYVGNVDADVSMADCAFKVTGTAPGTYDNDTGDLVVQSFGNTLTISQANAACAGIVANGDHPSFDGVYHLENGSGVSPVIVGSNPPS